MAFHNEKRAEVGSGPLAWSPRIAGFAQKRAEAIARAGKLAHLAPGKNPFGENLAQGGGGGGYTVLQACRDWSAEKARMPRGARIFTPGLLQRGVGHYTQMVWKGSREVGAGTATFEQAGVTWTVVVCCYDPPGNRIGEEIH